MSGNAIADTSAVLAFFNGSKAVTTALNQAETVYLPSIVIGELYFGLQKCSKPDQEEVKIASMIARTEALHVDYETGKVYALVMRQLEMDGNPIPLNDIWIAALSLQHGCRLIARDAHFECIKGIDLLSLPHD